MSAATQARDTVRIADNSRSSLRELVVKAATTVYAGTIVAVDSTGAAVPASDASGLIVVGVAQNTATAGQTVKALTGTFKITNGTAAATIAANLGNLLYIQDDQTVQTAGGSNSIKAGVCRWVEGADVHIEIGNIRTS